MKEPSRPAEPLEIDGIRCFAPELANAEDDYPAEAFARLSELEANNFWFRSRNRIILNIFRRFVRDPGHPKVLEFGCGTGFVLGALQAENRFHLVGADQHIGGLAFAKRRLPNIEFVQLNARQLPYRSEFHAIGAFDVLEHIDADEEVMSSVHQALLPNGLFVVTVPQHAWLWSPTDESARHKRRYARNELLLKLKRNGFSIRYCSSFVFTLLPLMYWSRVRQRSKKRVEGAVATDTIYNELTLPKLVNSLMGAAMKIDELLIAAGVSLPAGGSLLVVAQRVG